MLDELLAWLRQHPEQWVHRGITAMNDERMSELVESVIAEKTSGPIAAPAPTRRRPPRRRIVIALAALMALIAAGVAAAAILNRSSNPIDVACFADLDVEGDLVMLRTAADPVEACQDAWSDPAHREVFDGQPAPPLAGCRLDSGTTGVFPTEDGDPCEALGLDSAEDPHPDRDAIDTLEQRLTEAWLVGCTPPEDLHQIALDLLTELGLDSWQLVNDTPADATGLCGSASVDPTTNTIHVIAIPPPPPG